MTFLTNLLNRGDGRGLFVILTYDVAQKRVNRVRKICLPFLFRIQNSVFLGEISSSKLKVLTDRLKGVISEDDGLEIFILRDKKLIRRVTVGKCREYEKVIL